MNATSNTVAEFYMSPRFEDTGMPMLAKYIIQQGRNGPLFTAYIDINFPTIKTVKIIGRKSDDPSFAYIFPGIPFRSVLPCK